MGLQHYGNKVEYDGFTFDSTKEFNFYKRFIKDCGYDVKNGYTPYAIDRGAAISFKLFAKKYGIPVEVVVIRTHDFKTKILGTTKKYDVKIRNGVDYDWRENWCIENLRGDLTE